MIRFARTLGSALALVGLGLACACSSTDTPGSATGGSAGSAGTGGAGGSGAATCDVSNGTFTITDDTNYSLPSSLTLDTYTLKGGTDLTFDWSAVTKDFYGKVMDPKVNIDLVLISLWKKTPAELEAALSSDTLNPNDNVGVLTTYPTDNSYTSAKLLDFNSIGNPVPDGGFSQFFDAGDPSFMYPSNQYTFLMEASTGTVLGRGARMLAFFNLDPKQTATTVNLKSDSAVLDFSAHLTGSRALRVPAATPNLTIDWSPMLKNALGNEYDGSQITDAVVAHYADKTLADLEQDFVDLETIADGWWSGPVKSGRSISLAGLTDRSGATFPGVDSQGVWLAALFCTSNCNNPAPWSITVLEPCP